jgi:hypothetical protein
MLALLAVLAAPPVHATPPPRPPLDDPRHAFNRRRITIHTAGMATLTGWSLINLGAGFGLGFTTAGPERHFHQMNAYWNTVNLALGIAGLIGARREGRRLLAPAAAARARAHQSVFTWNAGLDVLYMATGALLFNLGQDRDSERLLGYGASILLQGGVLFVFDLAMATAHARNLRRPQRVGPAAAPLPGGASFGLRGAF